MRLPAVLRVLALSALGTASTVAQTPTDERVALVIGNAAYAPPVPVLANPSRDAEAMAVVLKRLGFRVVEVRDADRQGMARAVQDTLQGMRGKRAIAMFYYSGHGLQVDWRNYMVPVDARIASAADVPAQGFSLDSVMQAFREAGTRMNIVVLDACRDNPFAGSATGRGLAQADAPAGTFLAFATAPGNVADDGEQGRYGLYTGFLIQELARPAAKIEDVFKRVRLQVRQTSGGRQVPWESTSLEEDFMFNDGKRFTIAPEEIQRLAEQARERERELQRQAEEARRQAQAQAAEAARQRLQAIEEARRAEEAQLKALEEARLAATLREQERLSAEQAFAREKADWDRIAGSRNPDDFYEFLRKYPSGSISEHATAVLERLAEAKVRTATGKDGMVQVPAKERFRVGDIEAYRVLDMYSGQVIRTARARVNYVTEDTVHVGGRTVLTREGGTISNDFISKTDPPRLDTPAGDYAVGKKWEYRTIQTDRGGPTFTSQGRVRITAIEEVTVPAGTFKAYRVELVAFNSNGDQVRLTRWMRPEWGFAVKIQREIRSPWRAPTREIYEMTEVPRRD